MKPISRREFSFQTMIAGAALSLGWGSRSRAATAVPYSQLKGLKPKEWQDVAHFVNVIIPKSETGASAEEAGVLDFLSRAFAGEVPGWTPVTFKKFALFRKKGYGIYLPYYRKLVSRLNALSNGEWATLDEKRRYEVVSHMAASAKAQVGYRITGTPGVKDASDSDLYDLVRRHTIQGYFSDPSNGGNKEYVGWKTLGHVCHMNYPDRPETCPPHLYVDPSAALEEEA